jgi:hypothetical protein
MTRITSDFVELVVAGTVELSIDAAQSTNPIVEP